jgi:DNA-binding ferritin-like protein (Dps family)
MTTIITKLVGDKRRWREYKARTKALPPTYRAAADAVERYLLYIGASDGDSAATMFEDLADLFEQAAADGTPIRGIVGENPVEFAEVFLQNYAKGGWMFRERARLTKAIDAIDIGDASDASDTGDVGDTGDSSEPGNALDATDADTLSTAPHNNPPEGSDRT